MACGFEARERDAKSDQVLAFDVDEVEVGKIRGVDARRHRCDSSWDL